jgi:hypothetical protein
MEDSDRIKELEEKVKRLENCPYRCEICGAPTDGWFRVLFWTHYYCKKHFPYYAC